MVPKGNIALGKLAQAIVYGAKIVAVDGSFDRALEIVLDLTKKHAVTLVNSLNPHRLQGQKTAAFEVADLLGDAPDYLVIPVGNAGNISAYWMGYKEYHADGIARKRPVMAGYQAAGAAPFLRGHMVDNPETVATAIRIGHPQSWDLAWQASRESGGWFDEFTDAEILQAQKLLAEQEGIFCEPASAISLAGALRDIRSGRIPEGSTIACTLTGHGLKDPDTAIKQNQGTVLTVEAKLDAVKQAILSRMS
jgi:threonine synthase